MSLETKNVSGINYVKVDGEWIEEVNLNEMEQKLRNNINLFKKYNKDVFKTEDEIRSCIDRQLSPERIELYYKAQALNQKIIRSRQEISDMGFEKNGLFLGRMYGITRQYGTADQPDTKEINKGIDNLILDYSEEGKQTRKKFFISHINTVNSLDYNKIDFINSKVSFNEAVKYSIEHYKEMQAGVLMANYMDGLVTYGFAHNEALAIQTNKIKGKGEFVGGFGSGMFDFACDESFLTIPFEEVSYETMYEMKFGDQKSDDQKSDDLSAFTGPAYFLKYTMSSPVEFTDTFPFEYTEYDFVDKSMSLIEYKNRLCKFYAALNSVNGDVLQSPVYQKLLTATKNALVFIGNQNSEINEEKLQAFKKTLTQLEMKSSATVQSGDSPKELKKLVQDMRNDLSCFLSRGLGLDAIVYNWNKDISPEKLSALNVFETTGENRLDQPGIEGFISKDSVITWKKNLSFNSFECVGTNTSALQALLYLQDTIESVGVNSDVKPLYNSLKSAIGTLSGENLNNKQIWTAQLSDLESKAGACLNVIKTKMQKSGLKQKDATNYEIASSMLKIGQQFRRINPNRSKGELRKIKQEEMLTLLGELEADFVQTQKNSTTEYRAILDGIRLAKRLTEKIESQRDYEAAYTVLFESSVSYIMQHTGEKLNAKEKRLLDNAYRAALLAQHPLSPCEKLSQKNLDKLIVYSKFVKNEIDLLSKSSLPGHIRLAERARTLHKKAFEFIGKMPSFTYQSYVEPFSEQQLAEYSMLDSDDFVKKYKETLTDSDIAKEYIDKMRAVVVRESQMFDRNAYVSDDLLAYAASTKLSLTVSRLAVPSLAICLLVQDGYKVEDALVPEKFADIKKMYGRKAAQLIKDNKTIEIAKAYQFGCEKICDYQGQLLLDSHPITPEFLVSEKSIQLSLLSTFANDISQEMAKLRPHLQEAISELKNKDPNYEDKLTEPYEAAVTKGSNIFVGAAIGSVHKFFSEYFSALNPTIPVQARFVMSGLTYLKQINNCITEIKDEMQETGKSYSEVVSEINPGEAHCKYHIWLSNHIGSLDLIPGYRDKIEKDITNDPLLTKKLIKAFFEGKFENVTTESNRVKAQVNGLDTLINEVIDEKYKKDNIIEHPITLRRYSRNTHFDLVSDKTFTDTLEDFDVIYSDTFLDRNSLIAGRDYQLEKFANDPYNEDVDYPQDALDDYFKSKFSKYQALTAEESSERCKTAAAMKDKMHRIIGSKKLNLRIVSFELKEDEKQKISGIYDALYSVNLTDESIKKNDDIKNTLLKGSDADKANLIKQRLADLSDIDLDQVYTDDPNSIAEHLEDIYALYSAAEKIQNLIDEASKLGADFTSKEDMRMLHNLQAKTDFAVQLKHKIDYICSPVYSRLNESCLGDYKQNGKYIGDDGKCVYFSDYAKSGKYQKTKAFSRGLDSLNHSIANTEAEFNCHYTLFDDNHSYFVYKADENNNMVKGRIVDGQFVPAQVEKYGVVLDTIYRDDLRKELEYNIETIQEFYPDFEMSEEEISEQLSDENIEKSYRVLALEKRIKNDAVKINDQRIVGDQFLKRANMTYIQAHGEDKSVSLMSNGMSGDNAKKELIAYIYNKVIALDTDVFDFHGSFKNKENEGKYVDLLANNNRFSVDKEKFDKAFDYSIEHFEDLEYAMAVENSKSLSKYGFDLDEKLKPELPTIFDKGAVLGGIARHIRDSYSKKVALTMPINKLSTEQIGVVVKGLSTRYKVEGVVHNQIESLSDLQMYFSNGLNNTNYLEEPNSHHYTLDDFKTRRLSLLGIKKSLEDFNEKIKLVNDGSEIYASDQYADLIEKQEILLRSLSGINGQIDEQMRESIAAAVTDVKDAIKHFESLKNQSSEDVKAVLNPILNEYHEKLFDYSLDAANVRQSIFFWNENDSKSLDSFVKMKTRRDRNFDTDEISLRSESVLSSERVITWERVTSLKDFSSITTVNQALAAIKHLASGLDTTKKDHKEFKELKDTLKAAIEGIENAELSGRSQALNDALANIGTAAERYIIAKIDRLNDYGLSERSERRFEKAQDLCVLVGSLQRKALANNPISQPSEYKLSAVRLLEEYSVAIEGASVSGDSVEFKRLKEKMAYVRSMVSASDSEDFIKLQFRELADEGLDYYIKKIGEPIHGTRGKKLSIIRQLRQLAVDCNSNPIPHPAKDIVSQDYKFDIAAKMVKEMCKKNLKTGNNAQKLESKSILSDSKLFETKIQDLMNSNSFINAFKGLTNEQIKKAAEKSGSDLVKFYVSRMPKIPANRPADAYIKRISDFIKSVDTSLSTGQYYTKKEGKVHKNNKLAYSTDNTMLRTYAICELLNKRYSLGDILDPKKLTTEKKYFAKKAMRLVQRAKNVGDDAAIEITTTLVNGGKKLIECMNDLYGRVEDLSDNNLLSENGKQIIAACNIVKDVIQEAVRGIKQDDTSELMQEFKSLKASADTLSKLGDISTLYLTTMVKSTVSETSIPNYQKVANMIGVIVSQKHLNKLMRELKAKPENAGKTIEEMFAPDEEQPLNESKLYEVSSIMNSTINSGSEIISNLANNLDKDPLLCDKYIELNANGAFDSIDISYNPVTMNVSLANMIPVINNIKKSAPQPLHQAVPVQKVNEQPENLVEINEVRKADSNQLAH